MLLRRVARATLVLAKLAAAGGSACALALRLFAATMVRMRSMSDPYRPELHYMRGPGPRWRHKHGIRALHRD
jgi:hypothetical protein